MLPGRKVHILPPLYGSFGHHAIAGRTPRDDCRPRKGLIRFAVPLVRLEVMALCHAVHAVPVILTPGKHTVRCPTRSCGLCKMYRPKNQTPEFCTELGG